MIDRMSYICRPLLRMWRLLVAVVLTALLGGSTAHASIPLREKTVALDVAVRLGGMLQGRGMKVIYTRRYDSTVRLQQRIATANSTAPHLVVSVHANSFPSPAKHGTTTFFQGGNVRSE